MNAKERAETIINDILVNHLPRVEEGLRAGYVDENQILVMYDHAVRARILQEQSGERDAFKDFVHRRLDTAGVPKEFPDGAHTKEGCRIGDRLDWVLERTTR